MKQGEDDFIIGCGLSVIIAVAIGIALLLDAFFRKQPTNTTMHQPEPMDQYADSLVCPD